MWDSEELAGCQTSLLFQCWPFILFILLRLFTTLYFLRKTRRLKVNIGAFIYLFIYLTEKRNWPQSKRESSSSDQISFQFYILVFLSTPLPATGLHPEVRSILSSFQQIIENKEKKSLYVVGATTLPSPHLSTIWLVCS